MFISNLKISSVTSSTFFFLQIILAILVLLPLHMSYGTSLYLSIKHSSEIFIGIVLDL